MRLDKYLCEMNTGTRSQVRDFIRKGFVTVNGETVKAADYRLNEQKDSVTLGGKTINYRKFVWYMLNKPQGVISASSDLNEKTVISLLTAEDGNPALCGKGLFPVGRLDKDTEGLLLITNDGEQAHRLLSPKNHVEKTYLVRVEKALTQRALEILEAGVDIGEKNPTRPAKAEQIDDRTLLLSIHEGKYHQIKRMLHGVDNEVVFLKRIRFGGIELDESLAPGQYRPLTAQEEKLLYEV